METKKRKVSCMKKKIALLLTCIMALCLFAACGNKGDALPKEITTTAQMFVDNWAKGDLTKARQHFSDDMNKALSEDGLKEAWTSLTGTMGDFVKRIGERQETECDYEVVYVTNEFKNGQADIRVVFDKDGKISGMQFVPTSQAPEMELPETLMEQELSIKNGDYELPAVLTLPKDGFTSGLPIVVLVHGSGPNDRNETIGANAPFRDLAWGLAEKGIAVLRYDKRTKVYGEKSFADINHFTADDETVDDAVAAVSMLRDLDDMTFGDIYVLGHSLGAMLMPRIAEKTPEAMGYIMLGTPARPLEDIMLEQYEYLYSLDKNTSDAEKQKNLDAIKASVEKIKNLKEGDTGMADELLGYPASFWLDLQDYHVPSAAAQIGRPLLILQGERDYQVRMADFTLLQDNLGGEENVTMKSYPDLNHLFIRGDGDELSTPQDYYTAGHVDQQVIDDIVEFIELIHGNDDADDNQNSAAGNTIR